MFTHFLKLSVSSGVVTTYSATLIKNLGYLPAKAALMNMPSGVVSIFFTLLVGFGVRRQSHRWAWIIACIIPAYVCHPMVTRLEACVTSNTLSQHYWRRSNVLP